MSAMRKVQREDIVDYQTYEDERAALRERVMALKADRRVHVGPNLTLLFENPETIRYQVQEMMRAERIVRERDILHEIETYNELLGDAGELGFTLLIEIPDEAERRALLKQWLPLVDHVYVTRPDGERAYATFDPRQVGEDKLSSVHYMKVDVGGQAPVAAGCDFEGYRHEAALSDAQRAALASDLADR